MVNTSLLNALLSPDGSVCLLSEHACGCFVGQFIGNGMALMECLSHSAPMPNQETHAGTAKPSRIARADRLGAGAVECLETL
jgi:hypothetical protein